MLLESLKAEYALLNDLSFTTDCSIQTLSAKHSIQLIEQLVAAGFISAPQSTIRIITQAGAVRLAELRSLIAQMELVEARLAETNQALRSTQQELAAYKQQCKEQHDSDQKEAKESEQKLIRHDIFMAIVTFFATLLVEHCGDITRFVGRFLANPFH